MLTNVLQTFEKKKKNTEGETDSKTVTLEDFMASLATMNRLSRQEINMEILDLKSTLDYRDMTDIYRTSHPTAAG